MHSFVFEATFEKGVLKPDRPLPLAENQRIKVSVELAIGKMQAFPSEAPLAVNEELG